MPLTRLSITAGRGKKKYNKTTLSCHFHSLPRLAFSPYTQLLPSQPGPSILRRLIWFVPFKNLYDCEVGASTFPPWRLLLFPFCQITVFCSALKTPQCLEEYVFSAWRKSNGFVSKDRERTCVREVSYHRKIL